MVHFFNGLILTLVISSQVFVFWTILRGLRNKLGPPPAWCVTLPLGVAQVVALWVIWLDNTGMRRFSGLPESLDRALSFAAGVLTTGTVGAAAFLLIARLAQRRLHRPSEGVRAEAPRSATRRELLAGAAKAAVMAVPYGLAGYGIVLVRSEFELREVDFPATALDPALAGLRIALVSDIHFGPYLSLPELDRVIDMANETRPHLTLVTGDLITRVGDPLDTCLTRLKRLKAEAGVFGCLGNHEIYAGCEEYTEKRGRALGIDFLRLRSRLLEFGGARLNLAGVDYQRQRKPYLRGAGRLIRPGAINLLMSHNPDVFPVAANLGYDLVVGGHTHGGQVTVEILEQTLNVGRFFTPFVAGLYRRGNSSLYVSRGIGTINLPIRLGARPEVSLLRLRRV